MIRQDIKGEDGGKGEGGVSKQNVHKHRSGASTCS